MSEIQFPNYLNTFVAASEAGQQARAQRTRQNALSMIGTDPQGAQNALMQAGDFQGAEAVGNVQTQKAQTAARGQASQQYAAGDVQGATSTALGAGLDQLASTFGTLSAQQRQIVSENNAKLGGTARYLSTIPDPAERQHVWQNFAAPALVQQGVLKPEQVAGVDLSDQGLQGYVAQAQTVDQQLAQADKDRNYTETVRSHTATEAQQGATLKETARHNRADEGNANARLAADSAAPALNPDDLQSAGQMYVLTGQLPSLGMGPKNAATKTAIMHAGFGYARSAGMTPEDIIAAQAGNKADVKTLAVANTQYQNAIANQQTATQNGQVVREVLLKGAGPATSLFNKPIRAAMASLGNDDVTALNTAIAAYQSRVAAALQSGTGNQATTVSMQHEARTLTDPNATTAQILKSMDILDRDMTNVSNSRKAERDGVMAHIRTHPDASAAAPAPAQAQTPAAAPTVIKYDAQGNRIK